ncbi:hypothetical protein FSP39_000591 [Pinctada imbricata]|uniref:C1q domain-containing protein n=1 Tax=Pinctada imbricata TaxID=66713 RepID=A0AA88XWC9_PINIB|nr:hypothetical protein FSP39_000591 [Pinctada imbricata]
MSGPASTVYDTYLYHNGNRLMRSYSEDNGNEGHFEGASTTIVLSLVVGDSVWIQTTTGTYCYGYPITGFSGWKL